MAKVALIRCESYDYHEVKEAVYKGLHLIGGPESFVKPGEKIILKPNLLTGDPPEKCVTTHPNVFKAVGEIFKSTGAALSYGDSPGFGSIESVLKKTGIGAAASDLSIPLANFQTGEEVHFEGGIQNKKFVIAKGVLECDGLISLPKLKTHGLARMTGCVKNQFGCIPGFLKGEFHVKLPNVNEFAQMLIDLNLYLKPRLYVMDGIIAMEGNGPRGGTPKKMNVLLFSSDPIALDATICRMINLAPEFVPTITFGKDAGLGTYHEEDIEIVGDRLENFRVRDFEVKREPIKAYKSKGALNLLRNSFIPKPFIIERKCVKCGVCITMCPVNPKAVDWHDGDKKKTPSYKYNRCIRCYCCQELCPESAIDLKVPFIRKLLSLYK
ncbi:MAG: hypothetical protein CVU87_00495 [Firmicutes bacterium HGW-Firmicutes-12]|jgi:uncharacterized protein (DUF362 family)/NAD-dependent dihydropyrimidine dehydrogenase PreA subunit|nr:MAG: hypothetical protein CVU87_00495 [Firmicutes bacterium HGW-Firmicutes-12]